MSKSIALTLSWSIVAIATSGCAQLGEEAVIERFTAALNDHDLSKLRKHTSDHFESKALRQADALDNLAILRLPEEAPTVVKTEEVSPTQKDVTVEVNGGRRLLYRLTRDTDSETWVVDDIYMKQKKEGVKVTKSVTEQMDLLLSVREFLSAWQSDDRNQLLDVLTPSFAQSLSKVPVVCLADLTARTVGATPDRRAFRPEAQIDDRMAFVRLPRTEGELLISLELVDAGWKVDDVELRNEDNDSGSVADQAEMIATVSSFLDAYNTGNKPTLEDASTRSFFRGSLKQADLSVVSLPPSDALRGQYEIRTNDRISTFLLPDSSQTVKLTLLRDSPEDPDDQASYAVDDLTIYDSDGTQQRSLAGVFTSRARMELFRAALRERDLETLQRLSTSDLSERVWKHASADRIAELDLERAHHEMPVKKTNFRGSVAEILTSSDGASMTWVMREADGEFKVDDILVKKAGDDSRRSLKAKLELQIPLLQFAAAVDAGDLNRLRRLSSGDLNRLVWKPATEVPQIGFPIAEQLRIPPSQFRQNLAKANVVLGDGRWGANVELVNEHGYWVIDDIELIAGADAADQITVKNAMRSAIANRMRTSEDTNSRLRLAAASEPRAQPPSNPLVNAAPNPRADLSANVLPANYEVEIRKPLSVNKVSQPVAPESIAPRKLDLRQKPVERTGHPVAAENSTSDRLMELLAEFDESSADRREPVQTRSRAEPAAPQLFRRVTDPASAPIAIPMN